MMGLIIHAPGRINLIGEHTDYNQGFVLPAAIDKGISVRIKKNNTPNTVNVEALNIGETYQFDLQQMEPRAEGGWQNYVIGVVHELQVLNPKITGFDASFEGDIPIGSGMSSSAALECSLAYALNELFDLGLDKWDLIKATQLAEHHFVGTKCGIMDQFASIMGQVNQVMLLDCRSLAFQYFPLDLGKYQLLLLNTNVSHSLADSAYNARRASCEDAVSLLKEVFPDKRIDSLRDISVDELMIAFGKIPEDVARCCRHVVLENYRVLTATEALVNKDFARLGQLIYESHFSLKDDYEVSCPELDFLVEQTLDKPYVLGSRMMGGGFGGCTLNLIEQEQVQAFIAEMSVTYRQKFGIDLSPYAVKIGDGARRVN